MAELVSIKRNVDVSPGQAAPAVFHCSQGDVGSKLILGLLNNGTAYSIPPGVTVTIEGSESNGSIFTPISATASGSDITFYLTGEMTAVAGPAICQAVLKSGSNILGTANFTLEVESSPMGADAPPVFTDAGWTWMLQKLTTEIVPALGDNIIDAIDSKADQSDLTALSNTVAGHTGSITVLNNTVNTLNGDVTENRQNIATKLDKNQGTANAGKYLKVGADGNVETADLDVTTDKTLSIADKAADAKAVGDEITTLKADLGQRFSLDSDSANSIPSDSDLNDYTTTGNYKVTTIAIAETIANIPYETSGRLTVIRTTQSDRILQIYYCNSKITNDTYFRMYINGWGEWIKNVTKNDLTSLQSDIVNTISDRFELLTNQTSLISNVYSASKVPIEVKSDNVGNINVSIPSRIYVESISRTGVYVYDTVDAEGVYVVPNNSYLVEESLTKTISIKTISEIRKLSKTSRYNILCYNYNGIPLGVLAQYVNPRLPYYDTYIANIADVINTDKAVYGINGLSFYFMTDEHWKQNAQKSVYLINELRRNTGIDLVINGGDILTKETTKQLAYKAMSNFLDDFESTGCDVYSSIGNHEFNNPNMSQAPEDLAITLTLEEVSSVLYDRQIYNDATFDNDSMAYYKDFGKLRLFFLPCNYGSGVYRSAVWWIMDQMQNIPAGYHFAVVSHVINEWKSDMSTSVTNTRVQGLLNAMDALKNKQSFTYETRSFDYTNSTAIPVCMIGGHAHSDYSFTTTGGIPVIMTTCDSDIQESGGLTRTRGTTSEQAFDVVSVDFINKTIKLTRIGAGANREFTY